MRFAFIALLGFVLALASGSSAHRAESADVAGIDTGCVARASAGATNQAGLMVKFGDGRTLTYCVEFAEDSITGLELLRRSGLSVVTASSGGIGAAVCTIDGQGCNDPGDCFCMCKGGTCAYWAYFRQHDGAWTYSPIGAGTRTIRNGDADAWIWGNGGTSPGGVTPECAAPVRTATPVPTSTPLPPAPTMPPPVVEEATITPPQPDPTTTPPAVAPAPGTAPPTRITQSTAPANNAQVLGAARTPPPLAPTATPRSSVSSTPSSATPRTTTPPTSPAGVIRVSGEQGVRNATAHSGGDGWSWGTTLMFAGVALALTASGGVVYWRRRVRD